MLRAGAAAWLYQRVRFSSVLQSLALACGMHPYPTKHAFLLIVGGFSGSAGDCLFQFSCFVCLRYALLSPVGLMPMRQPPRLQVALMSVGCEGQLVGTHGCPLTVITTPLPLPPPTHHLLHSYPEAVFRGSNVTCSEPGQLF